MPTPTWLLNKSIDAIVFDCDGTLSTIEGIDELAKHNNVSEIVTKLTAQAMGKTGLNLHLYQERLQLVKPSLAQVLQLGKDYFSHCVADVKNVIEVFIHLQKPVYILSAGLYPSVVIFAELLGVPRENVFAVDITFDREGNYVDFDKTSCLTNSDGKREIVSQLKIKHPNILFVGDGLNDVSAMDLVTRFVGFGGSFYRKNIAERCEFYIEAPSMAPLLPLALTHAEYEQLTPAEKILYQQGLKPQSQCML